MGDDVAREEVAYMSTINKLRAKRIVLITLGVSLVAISSLVFVGALVNQNKVTTNNSKIATNNVEELRNETIYLINREAELELEQAANKELIEKETQIASSKYTVSTAELASQTLANFESFEKVRVLATGYTAGVESTGKDPTHPEYGITYSGVYVRRDIYSTIAADTSIFPLGTILYIPNYGYGVVADTGSAIKGYKIDLYYETVDEVYDEWGKKYVDVYIIELGNGKVSEKILDQYNQVAMAKIAL